MPVATTVADAAAAAAARPAATRPVGEGHAYARERAEDWRERAACRGLPAREIFVTRAAQAAPALRRCAACPVRRRCLEAVQPELSWFDGVCGGRLWRNGRVVEPR
ncbi:WhiB family transcriptional regulator [Kitasatospora sp. NPDC004289]